MRHGMAFRFLPLLLLLGLLVSACQEERTLDPKPDGGDTTDGGTDGGDGGTDGGDETPAKVRLPDGLTPADPNDAPPIGGLPEKLPEGVEVYDLGLVPVTDGLTPEIELDVDSVVYSFVVIGYAHDGVSVILNTATTPDGTEVVSNTEPPGLGTTQRQVARGFPGQFFSPNRVIPSRESGAFLVPNSPDVPFPEGTWTFQAGAYVQSISNQGISVTASNRPVRLFVLVNTAPERPEAGTLDLTLWFSGSGGITAGNAPDHTGLQATLDVMRDAYDAVGITIASIDYRDLEDTSLRTIVLTPDICEGGDLDTLFEASAPGESNRLNIFFVERFQCLMFGGAFDMGQGIAGISGGIPGMPYAKGTPHSGVAAATDFFANDPTQFAVVLAHETGHFLGLFHTEENNQFGGPTINDNISDTGTGQGARGNLMYFSAEGDTTLTPGQGFVMRNNPWVQP